jgi:hypothetical protein
MRGVLPCESDDPAGTFNAEASSFASSSALMPLSALTTTQSARIRVPLTIGWPETLPGIRSTSGQSVQSISVGSLKMTFGFRRL